MQFLYGRTSIGTHFWHVHCVKDIWSNEQKKCRRHTLFCGLKFIQSWQLRIASADDLLLKQTRDANIESMHRLNRHQPFWPAIFDNSPVSSNHLESALIIQWWLNKKKMKYDGNRTDPAYINDRNAQFHTSAGSNRTSDCLIMPAAWLSVFYSPIADVLSRLMGTISGITGDASGDKEHSNLFRNIMFAHFALDKKSSFSHSTV